MAFHTQGSPADAGQPWARMTMSRWDIQIHGTELADRLNIGVPEPAAARFEPLGI